MPWKASCETIEEKFEEEKIPERIQYFGYPEYLLFLRENYDL